VDKCKEQFEEWAVNTKDQFGVPFFTIKNEQGKYVDNGTEISWQAWQASRQALVVELPKGNFAAWVSGDMVDGYNAAIADVTGLLDAAGVNHK